MWFKGVLTSENLGTPIDSELLIYCLQADYILSHIWVCISKMLSSLDIVVYHGCDSPHIGCVVVYVDATACLLVTLLSSVVAAPQPLDVSLWFVYVSPQSIVDQLSSLQCGVDQLLSEFGGSHSELRLLSAFGFPALLVSVPVLMTRCSIVSVTNHSGACLALV
jgi:hypothetical protein